MDRLISPFARHLGLVTAGLGVLLIWAMEQAPLLAPVLAVAFVGVAFWWNLTREPGTDHPVAVERCRGCAKGCAECHEHLDVGEAA